MPKPHRMFEPLQHMYEKVDVGSILPPLPNAAKNSAAISIEEFGMLSAVLLRKINQTDAKERRLSPDDLEYYKYIVVDGGRRVTDAIKDDVKFIHAIIAHADSDSDALDMLTILMNRARSVNPLEEALALQRVVGQNESKRQLKDIALRYGIPVQTLRNLLNIASLHVLFHEAMREGRLKRSIAEEIARLTHTQQQKLLKFLSDNPHSQLKADIVKSVKLADKEKSAQAIFSQLEMPKTVDPISSAIKTLLQTAKGQRLSISDVVKRLKNEALTQLAMPEVAHDTTPLPDF